MICSYNPLPPNIRWSLNLPPDYSIGYRWLEAAAVLGDSGIVDYDGSPRDAMSRAWAAPRPARLRL